MKAVNQSILVQDLKGESCVQKIGDIVIPENSNEYTIGKVISVGEKVESDIKPGDTVYFYNNAGKTFTHELEEYRLINISEIIVVL
jgi:co-chaperonin GroES (HSP10)